MKTIVIAGGGTGGHVFPMLAVGTALEQLGPDIRVIYVGTDRGLEARVIPENGGRLELIDIRPLRGNGVRGFAEGASHALKAIPLARTRLKEMRADLVLSVGGYAGGPVALAARSLHLPVAILEPNSVIGLSNRLLTPVVERAYIAFPETERFLRANIVVRSGVPLRSAFRPAQYPSQHEDLKIVVFGGSQGAKALNEVVPQALAFAFSEGTRFHVVHQTGREKSAAVSSLYSELKLSDRVSVREFIDDVPELLEQADLVLGRAGACSIAELCAIGRPSILIPYPFAADDHQLKNARSLEQRGGCVAIPQTDATPERISSEIVRLSKDYELRKRMANAAAEQGRPDAAKHIAEDLLRLIEQHTKRGQA